MYKKILFATDGSNYSKEAAKHAKFLAKASDAELIVLTVVETSFSVGITDTNAIDRMKNILWKNAEKVLDDFENEINPNNEIEIKKIVDEGSPAATILDRIVQENIDLAIIGSSGKTGLSRFIIGSVAEKVVKSAACSVLVVH
ncbi:MAG: universal stress protein [Methanobrevibacter sp.]|jgi:nucleotide-binding universal stress UspA family protein|nr:universal stress protein [Candidatus Methanoflexus mossambicus]